MDQREALEFKKIHSFFYNKPETKQLLDIIENKKIEDIKVTLSLIDWFITNYCKEKNIHYNYNNKNFYIHSEYKSQLKDYKKQYFDPFNRGSKIFKFKYNSKGDFIYTTFKQLNFMKWCIKWDIINYIRNNFKEINDSFQKNKQNKQSGVKKIKKNIKISEVKIKVLK